MSSAPDHDPVDGPPPMQWARVVVGLVGLFLGLTILFVGLRTL